MPTLYILCGIPASGKTTWARKFITDSFEQDIHYVSRDDIRFSMLKENEDYFAHEKEVFKNFSRTLAQNLMDGFDVIADATHLNRASRKKLTNTIDYFIKDYKIIYVVFKTSISECCERNKKRIGLARLDNSVILNLKLRFHYPSLEEDERAKEVIEI